jgi:hypothetical protein
MRKHELLQLAVYKRNQAARFRKMGRSLSLEQDRQAVAEAAAVLEREANQLEAEAVAMDVSST